MKRTIIIVTAVLLTIGGVFYITSCTNTATTENTKTQVDSVASAPTTSTVVATDSTATDSAKSSK
jgi:hypothetical protein